MNEISSKFGSIWRKWDLHFHTPSSFDYADKSVTNLELIDGLIAAGIEVVAITDHNLIDVPRIKELQTLAGDSLTILPGIEFRSELGGSDSVHFIGIFPEDSPIDDVWTKLSGKLEITPTDVIRKGGEQCIYCDLADTAEIVFSLGGLISVHAGSKSNTLEGIKSANLINQKMKLQLVRESIDIFEIGAVKDVSMYRDKIFPHFEHPVPLIMCSDNHDINDYPMDGFFWLKGDRTFESLRQALYEPLRRVCISETPPLAPILKIETVRFSFPLNSMLRGKKSQHPFCFRGEHEINFSPYLTCLIGGRGAGKSTIVNLLHEKIHPKKNQFFQENSISSPEGTSIDSCVSIDDDRELVDIEFLQQNEIEQFAMNPERFTEAVFSRLAKIDSQRTLTEVEERIGLEQDELIDHTNNITKYFEAKLGIDKKTKELHTCRRIVDSFENQDYKILRSELGLLAKEAQGLRSGRSRLDAFQKAVTEAINQYAGSDSIEGNPYGSILSHLTESIKYLLGQNKINSMLIRLDQRLVEIEALIDDKKMRVESFLKSRGLSVENLSDVGKASERIAELEYDISEFISRLDSLTIEIPAYEFKSHLSLEYADAVTALLAPINEKLAHQSSEVRPIRLEFEFDKISARKVLEEFLIEQIGGEESRKLRSDHLTNSLEDVDLLFDFATSQNLVSKIDIESKAGKAAEEYLSDEKNFWLFKQKVREISLEVQRFRKILVYYDNKPIESSSFGQRCTAAIVVLVLLGNTPIIIDEPEAHLDSALIAKYLVELVKRKKQERQIIFATHNANFVINGDSELIHVLDMNVDNCSTFVSLTIENLEERKLLLSLEGGKEAFLQRESRYGIR